MQPDLLPNSDEAKVITETKKQSPNTGVRATQYSMPKASPCSV